MDWIELLPQIIDVFEVFIMGILCLSLPFFLVQGIRFVWHWGNRWAEELKAFDPHVYDVASFFAVEAVKYAEQKGLGKEGKEKLDLAVAYLERELYERFGLELELEVIQDKIEVAVFEVFNELKGLELIDDLELLIEEE